MTHLIKVTNVYRVPTIQDALNLREELEKGAGELTNFAYATKYINRRAKSQKNISKLKQLLYLMMKKIVIVQLESNMNEIDGCIYLHKNKINGKCYVGQTIRKPPQRRWQNGSGYISCTKFYKAIQKYGWDNFEHIILEEHIPVEALNEKELYYINLYDSFYHGYNSILPDTTMIFSTETLERKKASWNKKRRSEQSQRMKEQWLNPKFLEAFKSQDRITNHADMSGEHNPMYGTHRKGKEAARRVAVICNETSQYFHTAKETAEWLGSIAQKSHISEVCKGKRKYCGKHPITQQKLTWRYATNEEKEKLYI